MSKEDINKTPLENLKDILSRADAAAVVHVPMKNSPEKKEEAVSCQEPRTVILKSKIKSIVKEVEDDSKNEFSLIEAEEIFQRILENNAWTLNEKIKFSEKENSLLPENIQKLEQVLSKFRISKRGND